MHISHHIQKKSFPSAIIMGQKPVHDDSQILHIGVGGFHRAHQAYAVQRLIDLDPEKNSKWQITGVSLMDNDEQLVRDLKSQESNYCLRMSSSSGQEEVMLIHAIKDILYIKDDRQTIVDHIASDQTRIISFTITEGGYNIDFKKQQFMFDQEQIQHDLNDREMPFTVFGFLAKGLQQRMNAGVSGVTLLSCDNIQENGKILKLALLSFLEAYDSQLAQWVLDNCYFPNSMVDRITPITSALDKESFLQKYGVSDNTLVVSEDYFQWVIEFTSPFELPDFQAIGAQFVDDVRPYEKMKLSILNGGHTLVGLLGEALGYRTIHESVSDTRISVLFEAYVVQEVIPTLDIIDGVDFKCYFETIRSRFSNAMINDSTARIIGGSSDKIPKFVLPVLAHQLQQSKPDINGAVLIIALWWHYLREAFQKDNMQEVNDHRVSVWLQKFQTEGDNGLWFIHDQDVFSDLGSDIRVETLYRQYIADIQHKGVKQLITDTIKL